MSGIEAWHPMSNGRKREAIPYEPPEVELWPYRDRTTALLKRYARLAVEAGRLPSLLGRELFRARMAAHWQVTFEDVAILVHDVERALKNLSPAEQQMIAMHVLEDYSLREVARLTGCSLRTVERMVPEALDDLSRMFLQGGWIREMELGTASENSCQEGKFSNFDVSCWEKEKNIS